VVEPQAEQVGKVIFLPYSVGFACSRGRAARVLGFLGHRPLLPARLGVFARTPDLVCFSLQTPVQKAEKDLENLEEELRPVKDRVVALEKLEGANNLNDAQKAELVAKRKKEEQLRDEKKQLNDRLNLLLRQQATVPPAGKPPLLPAPFLICRFLISLDLVHSSHLRSSCSRVT
jgi:hypothetical protein